MTAPNTLLWECEECHQPRRAAEGEPIPPCACGRQEDFDRNAIDDQGRLTRCPRCGTTEFYRQKDFPQQLGVLIVGLGFVIATVGWLYYSWILWVSALGGSFLIDAVLFYLIMGDVAVCYRCHLRRRGGAIPPSAEPFSLAIGERYRQERLRMEEMKRPRT